MRAIDRKDHESIASQGTAFADKKMICGGQPYPIRNQIPSLGLDQHPRYLHYRPG